MWDELRKKTKYEIDLGNKDYQKAISRAELTSQLDDSAAFLVTVATKPETIAKLAPSQLPQSASFSWNDKKLFQGHLASVSVVGHSSLLLEYSDEVRLAKRRTENEFFKQQTLREVLEKLCKWTGLEAQFTGDFSATLPGFSLGDRTFFDLMKSLSYSYGFYFLRRAVSPSLSFFSLDKEIDKKTIDAGKAVFDTRLEVSGEKTFEGVEISFFDSGQTQGKKREISKSAFYAPISSYAEHPGYAAKQKWTLAKGRLETHVSSDSQFEEAEALTKKQLSKQLMEQEQLRLTAFEPLAFPGDRVQVKGATVPALLDGTFLARQARVTVSAGIPKLELTAIRP